MCDNPNKNNSRARKRIIAAWQVDDVGVNGAPLMYPRPSFKCYGPVSFSNKEPLSLSISKRVLIPPHKTAIMISLTTGGTAGQTMCVCVCVQDLMSTAWPFTNTCFTNPNLFWNVLLHLLCLLEYGFSQLKCLLIDPKENIFEWFFSQAFKTFFL